MQIQATSMEILYEATFSGPALELVTNISGAIRAFCGKISPRYPIRSEDIRIVNSPVLEDIRIKIALFNRNARIELSSEKMSVTFQAVTSADISIVEDCLGLITSALAEFAKDVIISQDKIGLTALFKAESTVDEVKAYFSRYAPQEQLIGEAVVAFPIVRAESGIRLTLIEPNESAVTSFDFAPAWRAPSLLLAMSCYFQGNFEASFSEKVNYIKTKLQWIFSKIDIQTPAPL